MNIETFSQTYWYIWFLVILFTVIFLIVNLAGILYFCKKRKRFLNQSNRVNDDIAMRQTSASCDQTKRESAIYTLKSKYQQMSIISSSSDETSSCSIHSENLITSTPNVSIIEKLKKKTQSDLLPKKRDIDLKEFQRQALQEHNSIRANHNKPLLKLKEALNIYAQSWAEECARTNTVVPSRSEWRFSCKGQPLGENIISANQFNGIQFTRMIMANGDQSKEVHCLLDGITTEVGFGCAQSEVQNNTQQQWIGVAHYYPYQPLTTVQS